jgi:N-acetylornithine carbamoyltransferase
MKTDGWKGRHWITVLDYTREELETILKVAADLKQDFVLGKPHDLLHRKTLFMIFYHSSLRTRNSFEAGMTQLGGHAHFLDQGTIYAPTMAGQQKASGSEEIVDTARTLSRMGHGIALRCWDSSWPWGAGNAALREYARWATIPVINMECDWYHPCQGMADLMTMQEKFGSLEGRKVVMSWAYSPNVGKPLSVSHSMLAATSYFGADLVLAHPKGYELHPDVLAAVQANVDQHGGSFSITDDMDEAFHNADVIQAKSWTSRALLPPITPQVEKAQLQALAEANRHWICDSRRMSLARKNAIYLHCLPCNRDYEVTREVIDGPQSAVYDEAENRLHVQKAIMSLLMG